ncbi:phosphoribosylanthranilate isomerase [Roseivirga sp.]|uniref:phosphoribosylanthranilate isomerase n=1 Tax=Roseivirga sp. TaxID=1964215 RepID=UPI003B51D71C
MALKTFVKVSGVNNLSDARYCAGMGVNQIGFNIEPDHANYTDPQSFKELSEWVSGVEFVGEIESNESAGQLSEIIASYDLQAIQVNHIQLIEAAKATGKAVIYYTESIDDAKAAVDAHGKSIAYILLEDESASKEDLNELASQCELVVGAGLKADSLDDLLEEVKPKGIALKGGDEIRPGYKDFDEMADILEALDADEWA